MATWSIESSPYRFMWSTDALNARATGKRPPAKDLLNDSVHFPPFSELCSDNEIDYRYYDEMDLGTYGYSCTWCFLGEITCDRLTPISGVSLTKKVVVRDRDGQADIPIAFYPEEGSFDYSTVKNGHTFCAMFALQHYFLDMSIGLRIEDLNLVKVIPCSLDTLFAISAKFSKFAGVYCWGCGEACADQLKKCALCGIACYCGKGCQTKDWKACHKMWCKALPEFVKLTKINYRESDYDALVSETDGRIW